MFDKTKDGASASMPSPGPTTPTARERAPSRELREDELALVSGGRSDVKDSHDRYA